MSSTHKTASLIITPGRPLNGVVQPGGEIALPGDKSLSHRAALFAALAEGTSRIENLQVSGVTRAMLDALAGLGAPWRLEGSTLEVRGRGLRGLNEPAAPLNCGNSATTLRLLAGALAACGVSAVLDGTPGLRSRPMSRIVEPLRAMGVPIESAPGNTAPLQIGARPARRMLKSMTHNLMVASAQVKSGLLLAGLAADGPTVVCEPGPSRDHSERMLAGMGIQVDCWVEPGTRLPYRVQLTPLGQDRSAAELQPLNMHLPGDFSAAGFLIVAAAITPGSEVLLEGVGLNPTRTGLLDALQQMGADITILPGPEQGGEPTGDLLVRHAPLRGITVKGELVVRMIDEFPAFAVAAAYAEGLTSVADASELRHKESDRISAMCGELRRLGVEINEQPDGFQVQGGQALSGGTVAPHGDHRLAMALAVAGLAAESPVLVQQPGIIAESFPNFQAVLAALGGDIVEEPLA